MVADTVPKQVVSPLRKCAVCGGALFALDGEPIAAKCYDLAGVFDIEHIVKKCNRKFCCTRHHYNYYLLGKKKVNTLRFDQLRVVFITAKTAFSMRFLRYQVNLQFRAAVSSRALQWTYFESVPGSHDDTLMVADRLRKMLSAAMLYYHLVQEMEQIGEHTQVLVPDPDHRGACLSAAVLRKYDEYVHQHVFPPKDIDSVREMIGDGHEKVRVRTNSQVAPRAKHGWFMLVHPKTLRILSARPQQVHENNDVVTQSLKRTLPKYSKCNGFLLDRQCKYAPKNQYLPALSQLEYFGVDAFHAKGHSAGCKYCGKNNRRIKRRFHGVNGSACESVFAWFRIYARIIANADARVHHFYVLVWSRMHNALMERGQKGHLPKVAQPRRKMRKSNAYHCSKVRKQHVKKRS